MRDFFGQGPDVTKLPHLPTFATLGELLLEGGGEFNHLTWQVHPTFQKDSVIDALSSLHEWSHHELNNVTSYGLLLTYFAFLARHADQHREEFADRLLQLVAACQIAHETYATWFSVELLSAKFSLAELQSKLPPDYRALRQLGEGLVREIPSPFLRQQAFLTMLRSCFEAPAFAQFGCASAEQFRWAHVRARDFPNARLEFIVKKNPSELFTIWGTEYCKTIDNGAIATALHRTRDQEFFDLPLPDADAALAKFLRWLSDKWRDWMLGQDLAVGPYECHLHLVSTLVDDMNRRCADSPITHPLRPTTSPHDTATVLLQQMETEIVRLRSQPLAAEFVPIEALPSAIWPNLSMGSPSHLFLQARSLDDLRRQHSLAESQIPDDFRAEDSPIVFLRRRAPVGADGNETVQLFYFRTPQELRAFRASTESIPTYGLVSSILAVDQAWCDTWLDPSILWLSKIDHSLSAFLLQHCSSQQEVRYSTATLQDGDRRVHFVTFLTRSSGRSHWGMYIGFCGEQTAKACVQVIQHKLDPGQVVLDQQPFEEDLAPALSVIATHMMRDESFFSFNQLSY